MRKLTKSFLSLLLIAAMLASFVVLPAAAEEPAAEQPTEAVQAAETQAADSSFMKIFHLDCGRKYFTKDWILALINEISAAGYTHLQLALGNDGMRFLLDDMSLTVNGTTYSSENVAAAIHAGNEKYHDFTVDELTEKEMDAIIAHAKEKNIEILPLINTPGHMDAILDAATSLTYTDCAYNGSSRTIDVTNDTAVAFTQALLQKYVTYFAGKGCKYFNIGADEYANDKYTGGSMGFGNLQLSGKYGYFIKYVNELATMVKSADMKPVAFNDGIEFYGVTSANVGSTLYKFDKDIIVSYWSAGWSGYEPQSAANLVSNGFKVINTTGDFYYVLGKGDNFDAGYSYASNWSNTRVCGTSLNAESVVGATFCVWCDYPGAETEQEIAQKIRLPLRAMAQRMKGESVVLDENELVSGGFKADGTINTDVDVAEDAATGIKVSAPGVKMVDVTVKTDNLPEVTGAAEVLAWEVTPRDADGNAYTGKGTVTLHIPEAWIGAKVYGAVVNEDGSITEGTNLTLDEKNHTITFTVPHFSTILAVKEYAAQTINLTVGQEHVEFIENDDVTAKITKTDDFDQYATLTAEYADSKTVTTVGKQITSSNSLSGATIVLTDGNGNYAKLNSNNVLKNTTNKDEATVWTVERVQSGYSSYYYLKTGEKYLNPDTSNTASYAVSSQRSSWSWGQTKGYYYTYGWYNYSLGYTNLNWGMARTTSATIGQSYEATVETTTARTTLTFKGLKAGTTYVTVDNIQYKVVVTAEDVTGKAITLEYWITNRPVTADGATQKTINAGDAGINTIDGVDIATLAPKNGTQSDGAAVVYYNARRLDAENKQTAAGGVDQTTTTKNGCSDITRIRYFGGTWSYFVTNDGWHDFVMSGNTVTDQVVAYYLQTTDVTTEITTNIVDWGRPYSEWKAGGGGNTWFWDGYVENGSKYVFLDFAVVYEDGTQNPSSFPTDNTLFYHFDGCSATNPRVLGATSFDESEDYEIYKVTVTDGTSTGYSEYSTFTPTYDDSTETTVWERDVSEGEPHIESLSYTANRSGKLVRVYVRAKAKPDSLTVYYINKKNNSEIYHYSIAVTVGTTFNANFRMDSSNEDDYLADNTVTNIKNVTQTVTGNLSKMSEIGAQYRYGGFTLKEVKLKNGNKEAWLYYDFQNEHVFVVDFGVPVHIMPSDINVAESGWSGAKVDGKETSVGKYGTATVGVGKGLTYTATKPMQGVETFTVTLEFTDSDNKITGLTYLIYLVPATTVYYEQNVATYSDGWNSLGTIAADKYQQTQPGRTQGYNNFGYDLYYEQNQLGANGSVMYTTTPGESAQLTFKGTGLELYLRTKNTSVNAEDVTNHSYMLVQVYAGDTADANNLKRMSFVDVNNLFVAKDTGYGYNTPCWTVDDMALNDYTVVVRFVKGQELAIDGFRVTNTLNPDNATTKDFYAAVGEANMQTAEIRNMVLAQANVNNNAIFGMSAPMYQVGVNEVLDAVFDDKDVISGAAIIASNGTVNTNVTVDKDLVNIGPKNEIYLQQGQAVVMGLTGNYASVQVGMRSLTGAAVTYQINSETAKTMNSTVDMYYPVKLVGNMLVIRNTSENDEILALTKLKVTSATAATGNDPGVVPQTTPEAIRYAMALMRGIDVPQFTDVAEDAWYHDYVYDLVYRGVVNGMTATTYEPEGKLTRAQFVKLLACSLADAETLKTYEGKHPFKDSEGHWAETYIAWAKDKGIVEGVSATEFDPEAPITREQMATIFGRYAQKQGIELPKDAAPAQSFPDADKISEYAREFVELMRIAGILNGYEDGTFRPQGNATRAEAAKLFSLFLSITDKLAK